MNNGDEMALKAAEFSAAAFMRRFLSDTSKSIAGASKLADLVNPHRKMDPQIGGGGLYAARARTSAAFTPIGPRARL
jgi:hypothetical protein